MEDRIWHKHWPKGQSVTLNYPETTVDTVLRSAAHKYPERAAIIFHDVTYSYQELWEKSQRFSRALAELGIGRKDVVAIHLANCPQFAIAYYGILLCGATFSPVNPLLTSRELTHQLNDCNAKVVITCDLFCSTLMEIVPQTAVKTVIVTSISEAVERRPMDMGAFGSETISFQKLLETHSPDPPNVKLDLKRDLAHLGYTGGTTGLSKGVELSHANVMANIIQGYIWGESGEPILEDGLLRIKNRYQSNPEAHWEYVHEVEENGCVVNVTPWFHAMGVIGYMNLMFLRGFTIVLMLRFEPEAYLDAVEKYKATYIGGAPPVYRALLNSPGFDKRDMSHVRRLASGAAPLAVELLEKLKEAFPKALIIEAYGLTEVTMAATYNPSNYSGLRKVGSVGIPTFDTDLKIVDIINGEKELPQGESGEICFKGPQCMLGYHNRPEETAEVIRDGWLHTGDIGYLDPDGFLTIVDRKKDMLIYKGYNVYPRELEELLFTHPAVANCAVIGLPEPEVGELAKAFVVVKPGSEITEDDLMAFVNQQVVPYKKIRALEMVSEIPVSAAGKVLKRELKESIK